jgi:hypothetical protein
MIFQKKKEKEKAFFLSREGGGIHWESIIYSDTT